jgi:phenylacetate-CoA ligase
MNLYQDVFFRSLDYLRGRRTIERLQFLRRSQSWTPDHLQAWQLARLDELLQHAKDHSPYYAKVLASVCLPLRSLEQLADIAPLTKKLVRENFSDLKCAGVEPSRFVASRTGGSTGEPMQYFWDKRGMDWNRASVYRSAEWAGTALGERTVQMSGSHFDYSQAKRLQTRMTLYLQRYRDLPVAFLTRDLLDQYHRAVMRFRPTAIWGYASGITAFAQHAAKAHPHADYSFLKALVTSSETLRPAQRQVIEGAFGAGKVFDHYGSREIYLGAECRLHQGYHLHAEVAMVEVVDENNRPCPPGKTGRILVTDLSNQAFPFIRYEIGDVGTMSAPGETCACGVTLPRLQSLEGRISDLLVLRDRVLTPPNFATLFSDLSGIDAYQIRQPALDRIDIYIVPGRDYSDRTGRYVRDAIVSMAGTAATVSLQVVPEIAVSESGKRRFVVSDVGAMGT